MTNTWKAGITSAIFSLSMLGVGAALTPAAHAQATMAPAPYHTPFMRGEYRSNKNVRFVRMRLERVIDMLQHDRHDYGGHREQALDLLQQARAQLLQAEQYEAAHPNQ